jgi:palmitoyltransferase ZDHHC9/14/18/palmitoyltransferase
MIKCDGNNYGSMDMSPECKPRPLNDTPSIGNYLIIARVFVLGPHCIKWLKLGPLFMCTMIGFDVFAYYMLK